MINIFQPSLGKEELDSIKDVFASNWIGKGKKSDEFEFLFSEKINVKSKNILSTTSCTEGIFQILEYLKLEKNSEVIIPSISFIGTSNAIIHHKLKPIFCDVDIRTLNPSVGDIEEKISDKTRGIILIHYGGVPCDDMDEIVKLCRQKNIVLIEDTACSPFSTYKGKNTGTFGDFGVWSFDSMKILVTGDGGMIYCKKQKDNSKLEKRLALGLNTLPGKSGEVENKWWEFDISYHGRRSIINDITASIGICQLEKVDGFIKKRKTIHQKYNESLSELGWLEVPKDVREYSTSSYYMYWIQTDSENIRNRLAIYLRENNIYTTFKYFPLHKVKYNNDNSYLPKSEFISKRTLCLPLHQSLSDTDVEKVVEKIRNFI